MLKRLQAVGVVVLGVLLVATACSDSKPNPTDPKQEGGAAGEDGAKGGKGGSAGKTGFSGAAGKPPAHAGTNATTEGGAAGADPGGDAGAAGAGLACPGCISGFCLEDGTCVDCLPSDDQCPLGEYCTDANTCAVGCKDDGLSCASGKCAPDHSCQKCLNDDECNAEEVCGAGECAPACTAQQQGQAAGCETGLTCCSLHCTKVEVDSNHCGTCGTSCDAGQFCGNTTCSDGAGGAGGAGPSDCVTCYDTVLANVCSIGKVVVILDTTKNETEGNRTPGRAIGEALKQKCSPAPEVIEAEQDSVDALNFTTGRPVSGGGELLVVAGGPFFQNLEGYVEEQEISPLYLFVDMDQNLQAFKRRSNDTTVAFRTIDGDNLSHDYFAIQFMRDAQSGSLVLNAQGFWVSGTTAAAYLMLNGILPNLSSYDEAWYVYEWTDSPGGDKLPSLDEIDLVASGN